MANEKDIIADAKEQYKLAQEADKDNHDAAKKALRFRALQQWDEAVKKNRESDPDGPRPCLTLDKTNQYIRQICNDQRQNRPAILVRPVDDYSDIETAKVYKGIIRHIEDRSNADLAYDTAFEHAVDGGFGYWRILAEYSDPLSFDQELLIKRIRNRFSVTCDPMGVCPAGSDKEYWFIAEELNEKEFKKDYPDASPINWDFVQDEQRIWLNDKKITIAEYYCYDSENVNILLLDDGSVVTQSEWDKDIEDLYYLDPMTQAMVKKEVVRERETEKRTVQWYKLNNQEVLDHRELPGQWIPMVQVIGNELDIEGKLHKTGAVNQAVMDGQNMYNYSASAYVEQVALQPKAPYIAADEQIEDYEDDWSQANVRNLAVLKYKAVTEDGRLLPAPQRQAPPQVAVGWAAQLQNFEHDIRSAFGMYRESLGDEGQAKSGRALLMKQREADSNVFHYIDNLSRSISHTGRILVDYIPSYYDTAKVARILGDDYTPEMIELNPEQEESFLEYKDNEGKTRKSYNLSVGKFDVTVETGPSHSTKRQEAVDALTQMSQSNPDLLSIIGDIMFRNMDWHGAEEVAERLKKMLPPELQDSPENEEGMEIPPQIIQMQTQLEQMAAELQEREQAIAQAEGMIKGDIAKAEKAAMNAKSEVEKVKHEQEVLALKKQLAGKDIEGEVADIKEATLKLSVMKDDLEDKITEIQEHNITTESVMNLVEKMNIDSSNVMSIVAAAMEQMQAPKKTTLIYDGEGNPVGSISESNGRQTKTTLEVDGEGNPVGAVSEAIN